MNKYFIVFLIHFLALSFKLVSQPLFEWEKQIGGTDTDELSEIISCADGGYLAVGYSYSNDVDLYNNYGGYDVWVVKFDYLGAIDWQTSLGGGLEDRGLSVKEVPGGNYILTGKSSSIDYDVFGNYGQQDAWLVKLSSSGSIIWQKCLGGYSEDQFSSIAVSSDGGYLLAGYSTSNELDASGNHGSKDAWVLKTDSAGNVLWHKSLGGSNWDELRSITETATGEIMVAGFTESFNGDVSVNHGDRDLWVLQLSGTNGNIIWEKTYGGSLKDEAFHILKTVTNDFVVSGSTKSYNQDVTYNYGDVDYWIVKIDASGQLLWENSFGGSSADGSRFATETTAGDFIICGRSNSNDGLITNHHGDFDSWIVKISSAGNLIWSYAAGGPAYDQSKSIYSTNDGGFIVGGFSYSDVPLFIGNADFWIQKFGADLSTAFSEVENHKSVFYPNPVKDILFVSTREQTSTSVLDVQGKLLFTQPLKIGVNNVNTHHLAPGIYFIRTPGGSVKKLVKN